MKLYIDDTICAIATAIGGGIGIIRISGEKSFSIAKQIFSKNKTCFSTITDDFESHKAIYGFIYDSKYTIIDEVILLPMKSPKSYTCENIIEIHCHGGVKSMQMILKTVIEKGARLAEPGEFTKRAFLNGRIDLSQAEAVCDIINAKTELSQKISFNQLGGNLSSKVKGLRHSILSIIANIEANIDYPENDIEELSIKIIQSEVIKIQSKLINLLESTDSGLIIKDGIQTVILGKPNVGKSSLLNALLNEDRAIVTDIPGTTRDVLQEYITIKNIPLKIIDTAGIRETKDKIEKIGVDLARKYADDSDLILFIVDGTKQLENEDFKILENIKNKKSIVLINKIDLGKIINLDEIRKYIHDEFIIEISAKNRIGLDLITDKLNKMFLSEDINYENIAMVNNARHKNALIKASKSLQNILETIENGLSQDFISIDLTDCYNYLGEIIGESIDEDIINKIFADFCLGK